MASLFLHSAAEIIHTARTERREPVVVPAR